MSGKVIALDDYRQPQTCRYCRPGFICGPHRLADLAARVEDVRVDVEQFRFCDWSTFQRLTDDVLEVVGRIVAETLPDERTARDV